MKILVTGAAGFIGIQVAKRLLARGDAVVGLDNFTGPGGARLAEARLAQLESHGGFRFERGDVADRAALERLFATQGFQRVVHLAAQAGVRRSVEAPESCIASNLVGFGSVLEACRAHRIEHLVYASSSSVYGAGTRVPFSEAQAVDHPLSLYAATKKANELMAHAYSHLFGLPTTGLRFFTVYGPWGRPDMACHLFTQAILEDQPIRLFNRGEHTRDFTYIDDVAEAVLRVLDKPATPLTGFDPAHPDAAGSAAPYRIFNVGHQQPVSLQEFVATLEAVIGRRARRTLLPLQPGDVPATCADETALRAWIGPTEHTPLRAGLQATVQWHLSFYAAESPRAALAP